MSRCTLSQNLRQHAGVVKAFAARTAQPLPDWMRDPKLLPKHPPPSKPAAGK